MQVQGWGSCYGYCLEQLIGAFFICFVAESMTAHREQRRKCNGGNETEVPPPQPCAKCWADTSAWHYWRTPVSCGRGEIIGNSRIIQQQHDGVELFPGSVISPERNNEVIKAVPCRLDWHDDELVFKAVSLRILKTAVPAALCADRYVRRLWVMGRDAFERRRAPTWSSRKQQNGAFSTNRWHKVGELPMYGELGG